MKLARAVVLVGAAAASVAAVACNAITGLSDYEKVACVGPCDSGVADAAPDNVFDSPYDVPHDVDAGWDAADVNLDVVSDQVEVDAPEDVAPDVLPDVQYDASEVGVVERRLRWARWQMPHHFFSSVPGADDAGLPRGAELTLVDASKPYFHDDVTGLDWTMSSGTQMPLGEAVTHCAAESDPPLLARLPTRIELVTHFEPEATPSVHPVLDVKLGAYWSQSDAPLRDAGAVREYWVVDFAQGAVLTRAEDQKAYVRCVLYQEK